jgi:uncharacterized alkaline shock family protein YloU
MTEESELKLGEIEVSPKAIETIARHAIRRCYGVVDMANKGFVDGLTNRLYRRTEKGIDVTMAAEGITIDTYVIVKYGTRIRAVAESIQNTVKFHIEKALGRPVVAVNVFVQGLRRD